MAGVYDETDRLRGTSSVTSPTTSSATASWFSTWIDSVAVRPFAGRPRGLGPLFEGRNLPRLKLSRQATDHSQSVATRPIGPSPGRLPPLVKIGLMRKVDRHGTSTTSPPDSDAQTEKLNGEPKLRGGGPPIVEPTAARTRAPTTARKRPQADEVVVLIPVFNDWESLAQLLPKLDSVLAAHFLSVDVLVVDDGSTVEPECELETRRRSRPSAESTSCGSGETWGINERSPLVLPMSKTVFQPSGRGHGWRRRG